MDTRAVPGGLQRLQMVRAVVAPVLQGEMHDSAITVTSLMPGLTRTDFFHRAHIDDTAMARGKKTTLPKSRTGAARH